MPQPRPAGDPAELANHDVVSPVEPAGFTVVAPLQRDARIERLSAPLATLGGGVVLPAEPVLVLGSSAFPLDPSAAPHAIRTFVRAIDVEAALDSEPPSVLLVDLSLADESEHLLRSILDRPHFATLPILAVRGGAPERPAADWFKLGVDDLLERDGATVAAALAARVRKRQLIARCLRRDPLTELPNAAAFCEQFESAASLAAREREPLCLALVDVDDMARVNERLGRAAADDVLRLVAATLEGSLRRSDVVARWCGNTFAVLLPHTSLPGSIKAMEKALYVLRRSHFASSDQAPARISASIGVVQHPAAAATGESLAAAARMLCIAKEEGRDRVVGEPDEATPAARPRVLLADDDEVTASVIRHRLERAGCEVLHVHDGATALQLAPDASIALAILNIKTPELDGFEVLRRLRSIRSLRGLPIIMLSSTGRDSDLVRGFQLGADDYLIKPFAPAELVARVQRLLERV